MNKLEQKIEKLTSLGYSVNESNYNGNVYYFINGLGDLLMNTKKIKSTAWLTADGDLRVNVKETWKSNGVSQAWLNQRAEEAIAKIDALIGELEVVEEVIVDNQDVKIAIVDGVKTVYSNELYAFTSDVKPVLNSKSEVFKFAHGLKKAGMVWKLALKNAWSLYKRALEVAKTVINEVVYSLDDLKRDFNKVVKYYLYKKNCKHFRYVK